METTSNQLVLCPACDAQIGKMATNCPRCGTPNTWIHPKIRMLLRGQESGVKKPFNYWYQGTRIWGERKYRTWLGITTLAITSLVLVVASVFISFWTVFFGWLFVFGIWHWIEKKQTFDADVLTGAFTSNDDAFWQPLKDFLDAPLEK